MSDRTMKRTSRRVRDREAFLSRKWLNTLDSTLEQLDGENWGEPSYDSYVVTTAHELRRKPLRLLSDEELRLAISQKIGLEWLGRLAVERLEANPLRSGDLYEGDLLRNLLRVPQSYWLSHQSELIATMRIATTLLEGERLSECDADVQKAILDFCTEHALPAAS